MAQSVGLELGGSLGDVVGSFGKSELQCVGAHALSGSIGPIVSVLKAGTGLPVA